jgi:hypothetical protein
MNTKQLVELELAGETEDFSIPQASRPTLGHTRSCIKWITEVKLGRREAGRSVPSTAEVKNGGSIPALPHTSSCVVLY